MTKTHLLVLICSLFFSTATWACGYYPENYELRFCMLNADIIQRPDLSFLNYSIHWYNNCNIDEQVNIDNNSTLLKNCAEWQKYLGKKIRTQDIITILESTEPDDFLQAYRTQNWGVFKNNSFIAALLNKTTALKYMVLAKKVEFENEREEDPWTTDGYWQEYISNSTEKLHIIEEAETFIENNTDPFLLERYACQLIRLYNIADDSRKIVNVYDNCLKDKSTIVELLALPKVVEAHYLEDGLGDKLSIQMFERKNSRKITAVNNLKYVKNIYEFNEKHQQAVYQAIKICRNPGPALTQIQHLIKIEPKSEYLPLIMVREINKLEDWILSPQILGTEPTHIERESIFWYDKPEKQHKNYVQKNLQKDKQYLQKFRQFVEALPNTALSSNLRHILIAYLCMICQDFESAQNHLQQTNDKMPAVQLKQKRMMQIALTAQLKPLRSETTRQKLAQLLKSLQWKTIPESKWYELNNECQENADDMDELCRYLSRQFIKQGDLLTAGLLELKIKNNTFLSNGSSEYYQQIAFWDRFGSPNDIEDLLMFKHKKNKTAFEQWLTPTKWANDYVYLDLKGTMAFRENDFKTAYQTFKKIPKNFWDTNYDFKSYLNIPSLTYNTNFDTSVMSTQYTVNKTVWVKEAYDIQEQLKTAQGTQRAKLCLQMGNIIRNTSIEGDAWMMKSYGWGSLEPNNNYLDIFCSLPESKNQPKFTQDEQKYYSEALKNAGKDQEIAAQACLMLHLCKNKNLYDDQIDYYGDDEKPKLNKTYLNILRKKYANTQTFAYLRSTCSDVNFK
jgi:hypothetical protein